MSDMFEYTDEEIRDMLADAANDEARDLQDERDEYWPLRDDDDSRAPYDYEEDRTVEEQEHATAYAQYAAGEGWPLDPCTF